MITTAAVDTPAGPFAGATATTGDIAVGAGPAFGQVLSANVAPPVASTAMPSFRAMPGITTLPIGTLVGTGSLPFSASSMPLALGWSTSSSPATPGGTVLPAGASIATASVTVSGDPAPVVLLKDAVVTDEPPTGIATAVRRVVPAVDESDPPVAAGTPRAIPAPGTPAASVPRTGLLVGAPLPNEVAVDLPVSTEAGTASATPVADTDDGRPLSGNVAKVDHSPITPVRPAAIQVAQSSEEVEAPPPTDPEPAAPNEKSPPSDKAATVKRTDLKRPMPDKSIVVSTNAMAVPNVPQLMAPVSSAALVIASKDNHPALSDDDPSDISDRKPIEVSASPPGIIPLPIDTAVLPAKTATVASGRPDAAMAPAPHPATIVPAQADGTPSTAIDTSDMAAPHPAAVTPRADGAAREETRVSESRQSTAQPASFAALITRTETTAAPAPAPAASAPPVEQRVTAEPGRMGQEMGVAIARHAATGGGEAMTVRLDPVEFGRIEVTLSFDDSGTIRAVVAAESPAALDLLRRDSADLGRSLAEAGIRSDAQSFRFDTRQGSADGSGQGGQRWQQQPATGSRAAVQPTDDIPEPRYRPLRTSGRVDLMA